MPIRRLAYLLALACLCAVTLHAKPPSPEATACYVRKPTWPETMVATRAKLHELAAPAHAKAFTSDVIRGSAEAKQIEVDISAFGQLWLVAEDAGDGIGCDHSAWGDPELVDSKGTVTLLTTFKPKSATVGWQKLFTNQDVDRKPITVQKKQFKTGLFAHARSRILFDLPAIEKQAGKDFVKLRVWIGIASTGRNAGSCRFRVMPGLDRNSLANPLWDRIAQDFPADCQAFAAAIGGKRRNWLLKLQGRDIETAAIGKVLGELKPHDAALRQQFARLTTAKPTPADTQLLTFFQTCVEAKQAVGECEKAFALAEKTLDFVEREAPRPELRAQFAALSKEYAALRQQPNAPADQLATLLKRCRTIRRATILSHPALDFGTLLISQSPPPGYSHMCDQYLGRHRRPGPGLVLLKDWKSDPKQEVLLAGKLPEGVATHPDLSYDAKRILFSYSDTTEPNRSFRRFLIHEYDLETGKVRQVTGTPRDPMFGNGGRQTVLIEDFDPCYLPDGGFAFVSTRSQNYGRCHGSRYTPAYMVYRGELDGSGIRQLSFGEANEWEPSVLHDGRLIYTRWDYINRHDVFYQGIWTMRPDGTGTAHYFGSYTRNPCMTSEVLAIPGSHQTVCTAMGHHSYTAGSVMLVNPRLGQDGAAPVTRITPEVAFPETEGRPIGAYISPYALSEDLYLVAYTPDRLAFQSGVQRDEAYGIYLIDTLGGRELIYRDPKISSYTPIPVRPRTMPPALASPIAGLENKKTGTVYVQNVNRSTEKLGGARIASLRLNQIYVQTTQRKPALSRSNNENIKGTLGTVTVGADGASAFKIPAGMPVQLQALDEKGMAIMTMRSFIYVQPGENLSCVGCHEHRLSAPPRSAGISTAPVRPIQPPPGPQYAGGFNYVRTVQPVLDRHCISCHGLKKPAGKLDLTGTPQHGYSKSHNALVGRRGLVKIAYRNKETAVSKPRDYFAHAGKLAPMLAKGHRGVKLSSEELGRIVNWLDLNAQFYGDYSHNRVENRPPDSAGEKALRAAIAARFGSELAKQPFHTLVNPGLATESRILNAALPVAAGGWGQIQKGAFADRNDPAYAQFLTLVEKSITPLKWRDRNGTCNRGKQCRCGDCWVEEAEKVHRRKMQKTMARK